MKEIKDFAVKFINDHFGEIDLKKVDWNVKSKDQAIRLIQSDPELAGWVIGEVMRWGCRKDYLKESGVEEEGDHDFFVINLNGKYFSFANRRSHEMKEVFPIIETIKKLTFKQYENIT